MKQSNTLKAPGYMQTFDFTLANVFNAKLKRVQDFSKLSGITAIYTRLSKEDKDRKDESYSIQNQITLLLDHAKGKGLTNILVFVDDGLSGVFFDDSRPSFVQMMALVQQNQVSTVIVKDLSRLGRNYREAGECTETIFPYYNVRFIAVGDGIDKRLEQNAVRINTGFDINIAFKNLMNEGYVQDLSNKLRLAQSAKSKRGYPIGRPPYGYMRDEKDKRRWAVDEEAAAVVRKIFALRLGGNSVETIAEKLRHEKVLVPSLYAEQKGYYKAQKRPIRGDCFWEKTTIRNILDNRSYVGDVINFKTYTLSYKDKTSYRNDEANMDIHLGVHEPIIDRETFEIVQKSFKRNCRKASKAVEKHPLAGFLKCPDCGANLHYKLTYPNNSNHYFSCGNNKRSKTLCPTSHHIRVDEIVPLVIQAIDGVVRFARDFEDDFVKIVVDEKYKVIKLQQDRNKRELAKLRARETELDAIFTSLYEDKVKGTVSEEMFIRMSSKYEVEQQELKEKVVAMQTVVDAEQQEELNVDGFLKLVRRYTRVNELTPEIVQAFINHIDVYHKEKSKAGNVQTVDIYFNMVGKVTVPTIEEKALYIKSFARKKENHTAIAV